MTFVPPYPHYIPALQGILHVPVESQIGRYQGDLLAIVVDDSNYEYRGGFLAYGYGSCAGCDDWERRGTTPEGRIAILADMVRNIRWFKTPGELVEWLKGDSPDLQWYGHEPGWIEFVNEVAAVADKAATPFWGDFMYASYTEEDQHYA